MACMGDWLGCKIKNGDVNTQSGAFQIVAVLNYWGLMNIVCETLCPCVLVAKHHLLSHKPVCPDGQGH